MPTPALVSAADLAGRPSDAEALRACLAVTLEDDAETLRQEALELLDVEGMAVVGRDLHPAHWTSSVWLIDPDGWVLLMYHPTTKNWQQFGGHPDGDGCLIRVALREAEEESGLEHLLILDELVDLDYVASTDHSHYDTRYLAFTPSGSHNALPISPEGHTLCWMQIGTAGSILEDQRTAASLERTWNAAIRYGLVDAAPGV